MGLFDEAMVETSAVGLFYLEVLIFDIALKWSSVFHATIMANGKQ